MNDINGNSHLLVGTALGTAAAFNASALSAVLPGFEDTVEGITLLILGSILGSVLPDIDNPSSHIGQLTSPVSDVIGKAGKIFGKTGSNHRGIFHDLGLVLIIAVLCVHFFPPLLGLCIGYVSHLLLDALNPSGVPFLFIRRLRILPYNLCIKSGGTFANVFSGILTVAILGTGILIKKM